MILVDSSVWIDHLRKQEPTLERLLEDGLVLAHPFVIGEIALGRLRQRAVLIGLLLDLPMADAVTDDELIGFIELHGLFGHGIGLVDAHLLASVRLTADATLWTRNKRLLAVATTMNVAAALPGQ